MTMEFEGSGDTRFTLLKKIDDGLYVHVVNSNWSTVEGVNYKISYHLNGTVFEGGTTIGVKSDYKRGFLSRFGGDFERDFAAAPGIRIYVQDKLVDNLSLSGSAAALALVNQCLIRVKREVAEQEREKARLAHIPTDPFQGILAGDVAPNSPPIPRGDPGLWATTNDYPSRALREQREGRAYFTLTVGADGRVTDCQITTSSGYADLDQATCDNARRRARFAPATDEKGQKTIGTFSQSVNWIIPKD